MSGSVTVARKEIRDHLRDGRSIRAAAMYTLMGPAVILLVSQSAAAEKGGAPLLLSMMSVFALVSAFTGGMYIALDSTAGERERGSLVPLLLNPVSRLQLVVGKWIGISVFTIAGLALTLAGFVAVFEWGGIEPSLDLLTGATSRTLKDAQARLSIAMFMPMVVGMFLVFFPEWIGRWWFAIPIVGQQALIGAGLRGESVSIAHAGVLGLVTLMSTAVAVLMAARAMNRDTFVAG
jgi:sodium transport system permease protein